LTGQPRWRIGDASRAAAPGQTVYSQSSPGHTPASSGAIWVVYYHAPWLSDAPQRLALFEAYLGDVAARLGRPERFDDTLHEPHEGNEDMVIMAWRFAPGR